MTVATVTTNSDREENVPMHAVDPLCVNTLRFLSVDMVERAKSGHPGLPLGAAPMAYVLWDRHLRHNPADPEWFDRDRFLLSAGHGCALLYALLHMTGYDLTLDDLRAFRQWGSRTPGHPEVHHTPGVEATTGPLGQGFGMGVGMAIAEEMLRKRFTRDGVSPVDHWTYAIVSDGDLMEGVASEAASLAGTLRLGRIVYLYDQNGISIEGSTDITFREDVRARFDAYGWHTQSIEDGNDLESIDRAIRAAREEQDRPSLILVRTQIGYGSPKQGTAEAHGEPLGREAALAAKRNLGWPESPDFYIPQEAEAHMRKALERGRTLMAEWESTLRAYRSGHAEQAALFATILRRALPEGWDVDLPVFRGAAVATRDASGRAANAIGARIETLVGGAADLAPSTKTLIDGKGDFSAENRAGRNLRFGVREHAMGACVNGMARHGGLIPYGATFLTFCDYMRPSIRLAALMQTHSIFVFTHDSIGLGEDGPTHQPVEHLMSLRAIPGLLVLRPADANETVAAWRLAIALGRPVALALTRQKVPVLDPDRFAIHSGVARGGYVLADAAAPGDSPVLPDVVLIGTGSEVQLVLGAQEKLAGEGIRARAVSLPSWELFREQDAAYRDEVLPPGVPRLAVEAGASFGWREIVGDAGRVIGLAMFGASAPGNIVMEQMGFTVDHVVDAARAMVETQGDES